MFPNLLTLPGVNFEVKSYGVMLMIGFLLGTFLAVRRAIRVHAEPDIVLNLALIALAGGLIGARLFYVQHYWSTRFAYVWLENTPFSTNLGRAAWAIVDIRQGGLEFFGGFIGAVVLVLAYLKIKGVSIRWYMDILAPSVMLGVGFGRVGCFLNGCCFGRVCQPDTPAAAVAVRFPYASSPFYSQWNMHDLRLPPAAYNSAMGRPDPLPETWLRYTQADIDNYKAELAKLYGPEHDRYQREHLDINELVGHLNKNGITVDQFRAIIASTRSLPVYPTQLFSSLSGFTLWLLLAAVFRYRRRHGVVILLCGGLYSVNRFFEEAIRNDNPMDTFGGLTISQGVSVVTLLICAAGIVFLYKRLPLISPKVSPVMV